MDHSVVLCWFHPFCALHRITVSSIKGRVGARYKYNFRKQDFSMLLFIVGYFWTLLYSLICRSKRPVGWIFGYLSGRVSQRPNRKLNIAYSQNQPRKWLQISVKQKITSASVELTQTRHSHSKQLFQGGDRFQCFYREGQKASYAACKPLFLAVAEI